MAMTKKNIVIIRGSTRLEVDRETALQDLYQPRIVCRAHSQPCDTNHWNTTDFTLLNLMRKIRFCIMSFFPVKTRIFLRSLMK
jgi:hypothetical protein